MNTKHMIGMVRGFRLLSVMLLVASLVSVSVVANTPSARADSCTPALIGGIQIDSPSSMTIDGSNGGQLGFGISPSSSNSALGQCTNIQFNVYILENDQTSATSLPSDAGPIVKSVNGFGQYTLTVPASDSQDCQITEYVQDSTGTLNDTALVNVSNCVQNGATPPATTGTSVATNGGTPATGNGTNTSGCSSDNGLNQVSGLFPTQYCSVTGTIPIVINLLLGFLGIIAVVFIIIGGYWMVVSAGNDDRFKKGRQTVTYAVIGLLVALFAYTIIALVGKTVVNLGNAGQGLNSSASPATPANTSPSTPTTTPGG